MNWHKRKKISIANTDLLLVGLLLAGGAENYVDIEEIAVKCHQIAPTQFRWRLFDYPSLEAVQRGVGDLRRMPGEPLISKPKSNSTERMLTARGIQRAVEVASRLLDKQLNSAREAIAVFDRTKVTKNGNQPKRGLPALLKTEARPAQRALRALRRHPVFQHWATDHELIEVARWQLADVLNCLPDSPAEVWRERLERLQAQAAWWEDHEAKDFLRAIATKVGQLTQRTGGSDAYKSRTI
jgi:hypothetical protein